jgi:hypothetical protein
MARLSHLAKRGLSSAFGLGPRPADDEWARTQLIPAEQDLWRAMSRVDRRHAVGVARRVAAALDTRASRPVLAAALLHDVGKIEAGLGTYRRIVATLSAMAIGHDRVVIDAWVRTSGFTRKVGLYLQHDRLGGDLLAMAGSDPLTVAWARQHHLAEDQWTVPAPIGRALKDADDD